MEHDQYLVHDDIQRNPYQILILVEQCIVYHGDFYRQHKDLQI